MCIAMCTAGQLRDERTTTVLKRDTIQHPSALIWKEILTHMTAWMDLKGNICHSQKHKHFMIPVM